MVLCPSSVVRGHFFYLVYALEATFSKTRSLHQILEKPCLRSRGHNFSLILMKLNQNVCLNEISDKFENGSYQI